MKKDNYSAISKIPEKEFLGLFQGSLKKLFIYAQSQKILIKPINELLDTLSNRSLLLKHVKSCARQNIPIWVCCYLPKTIFADIRNLSNQRRKIAALANFAFAHEIAHIEFRATFREWIERIDCESIYTYDCIVEEYRCWKKGLEILKKLDILIDVKFYWECAFKFIGCHRGFCLNFKKCRPDASFCKIKKQDKKNILFWQKQEQELGTKKVLKKYPLV